MVIGRSVPTHSAYERAIYRHLRREKRKARRTGDELKEKKIAWTLSNPRAFELACEQIIAEADVPTDDLEVNFFGDGEYGVITGLMALLAFLVANWDSIAKIIEYIINLWASKAESVEQAEAKALSEEIAAAAA